MKQTVNELESFPLSTAVISGTTVYVSGQIGVDFETGELVPGGMAEQTKQALDNLEGVLIAAGSDKTKVLKTTVFLTDFAGYDDLNKVYKDFFRSGFPACSTVGVAELPRKALVEIECVAEID